MLLYLGEHLGVQLQTRRAQVQCIDTLIPAKVNKFRNRGPKYSEVKPYIIRQNILL